MLVARLILRHVIAKLRDRKRKIEGERGETEREGEIGGDIYTLHIMYILACLCGYIRRQSPAVFRVVPLNQIAKKNEVSKFQSHIDWLVVWKLMVNTLNGSWIMENG